MVAVIFACPFWHPEPYDFIGATRPIANYWQSTD